jgi:hypothetical protein
VRERSGGLYRKEETRKEGGSEILPQKIYLISILHLIFSIQ